MTDYAALLPYCMSESQAAALNAMIEHGSYRKAAKALGVTKSAVGCHMERIRRKAAVMGYSPDHDMQHTVPDGYIVKGVSTYYNKDGKPSAQWVKSSIDTEKYIESVKAMVSAFVEEIKPVKAVAAPKMLLNSDLLNTFVITDYHLGCKSWKPETGADWDLKIAEDLLIAWFAAAIKQSPDAKTALLLEIGDFLHFDGLEAVTSSAGHILDADTRFQLVVRVAIRCLRKVITMLLEKHENVHIVVAEGNHDIASSVWMREMLCALYEGEPRVTIDCSPDIYYCYEHGQTSVFAHHGHKAKFDSVDEVMVAKFRDVFGRTKHSYVHIGHYHHNKLAESRLMTVEQHRTLAAPDAYASRHGFMSGREAKVITYHKRYGEIGRLSISPDMVM